MRTGRGGGTEGEGTVTRDWRARSSGVGIVRWVMRREKMQPEESFYDEELHKVIICFLSCRSGFTPQVAEGR